MTELPKRRRIGPWLLGVAILALLGVTIALTMFSSWSDMREADPLEAQRAFEQALAGPAAGAAYLRVDDDGEVQVDRSLEGEQRDLEALVLLAWDPDDQDLLHTSIPFWFVRLKSTDQINLGTVMTVLAKDWEHLELSVTEEDLQRRGPGLVLDTTTVEGARLMLWLE